MATTLRDIARLAKVSVATVSYVLNGVAKVSPQTRERVLAAMNQLNYYPNAIAKSLVKQRSHVLTLFLQDITNPFFPAVAKAVEDVAVRAGYSVILYNTGDQEEKEAAYVQMALEQRVAGIIFCTVRNRAAVQSALDQGTPVVIIEWPGNIPGTDVVQVDNVLGARLGTEHLIQLGHRRVALINWVLGSVIAGDRLKGYKQALAAAKIPFDPALLATYDFNDPDRDAVILKLLALPDPPTAVLAVSDAIAIATMRTLHRHHRRVPRDLSIVGYDDTLAALSTPQLTSVAQPIYQLGTTAAQLLLDQDRKRHPRRVTLEPTLVVRDSTAERRQLRRQ
ncbi:MAG: LacI family DNA-binding transcriptional regulator [Deinococcus sp.]|nr:LacI family DNA-binding transcriptional regulator [Deinococcus sp.]